MEPATTPTTDALPTLSTIEARILGCLIEKQATTPENYPLTANALVLACNQKTARDPVLELQPGAVGHALRELEDRRLVLANHGSRAQRYEHRFTAVYSLTLKQQAVLALMMLRGPQTVAELHARSERLAPFGDSDEVQQTLERLAQRSPALVIRLGRLSGQREDRYMHLLCGPVDVERYAQAAASTSAPRRGELEARIEALEQALDELRTRLDVLTGG
ncbi:MAG: YceH family protein [Xanthomonadaceae bacterium]|nr:YceH family protein [Xanthomonadaceae bacterium]MDP2186178.1 YceH family protein [Xanthomonadales bacterium]MDZ4114898.1 YceH family protein [Xanthomonadaceae bacterium]MDZ4377484.1 YceH family protein [Xanthomonadaceae bacterium]